MATQRGMVTPVINYVTYENGPPVETRRTGRTCDTEKGDYAFLSIFRPHAAATTIAAMPIMSGTARSTMA